jgi:AraC family transcriptional regulator of adaptative response/methylated-DNA-[protein]-cysteine methyltransferase
VPELVWRLSEAIDRSPTGKLTGSDLRALGVAPATARRQFQRYCGLTFAAYCRARRLGQALHQARNGETVIAAQLNAGFESSSGFWQAFKRVFGAPASQADQINCLHAQRLETPLGPMLALANQAGLFLLEFADRPGLEREIAWLRRHTGCVVVPGDNPHLASLSRQLQAYFAGAATHFTVPLVLAGTPFERDVWACLQTISPGQTRSYAQLAHGLGRPAAVRAVGRANARNRLALVVPCHRVVGAGGKLCGYGGGVWRKHWLLEHERRVASPAAALGDQAC